MGQVEMTDISNDAMVFHCDMEINRLHQQAGEEAVKTSLAPREGHAELLFVKQQKYCL